MTALYAIGLVMWVGLIHVMVVEPLRGHTYRTRGRFISLSAPPGDLRPTSRSGGHRISLAPPRPGTLTARG